RARYLRIRWWSLQRRPEQRSRTLSTHWAALERRPSDEQVGEELGAGLHLILRKVGDPLFSKHILVDAEVTGELAARFGQDRMRGVGHDLGLATSADRRIPAEQILHCCGGNQGSRPECIHGDALGPKLLGHPKHT